MKLLEVGRPKAKGTLRIQIILDHLSYKCELLQTILSFLLGS